MTNVVSTQMDPSTRFVRSLDGEYFMLREAAEMLGVSHRTLRRMIEATKDLPDEQKLGPSFCTYFGKVRIYLYTVEDIRKIRAHLDSSKVVVPMRGTSRPPGRPRRWTKTERRERQRLFTRAHYYRTKAERQEAAGEDSTDARAELERIRDHLDAMEKA